MYFHTKCNGQIYIDKGQAVKILSSFTVSQTGIKLTNATISRIENKEINLVFICSKCGKIVELREIYGACMQCGKSNVLNELYKVAKHSGHYCLKCCDEYYTEFPKKVITNLFKFNGKKIEEEDLFDVRLKPNNFVRAVAMNEAPVFVDREEIKPRKANRQ